MQVYQGHAHINFICHLSTSPLPSSRYFPHSVFLLSSSPPSSFPPTPLHSPSTNSHLSIHFLPFFPSLFFFSHLFLFHIFLPLFFPPFIYFLLLIQSSVFLLRNIVPLLRCPLLHHLPSGYFSVLDHKILLYGSERCKDFRIKKETALADLK